MLKFTKPALAGALLSALALLPMAGRAGILEDDEARKAILDLRAKVDAITRELNARLDAKADKNAPLELANQIEGLRQELAKVRGEVEVLSNEVNNAARRQKDFYTDLDARLRKLEPQKVNVDGVEATVDQGELHAWENAQAVFKGGDYKAAANALADFVRRYPESAYAANAQFMLGNAFYLQRDCKSAIGAYQALVKTYADFPKAGDAMLSVAMCQAEKDAAAARKTLDGIVKAYPNTEAAKAARERLAALKEDVAPPARAARKK